MAANKKRDKPKIEIQTRKPEKRGIFANVGSNRSSTDSHPLREILNFPITEPKSNDDQSVDSPSTDAANSRPQNSESAVHNSEPLPSTNLDLRRPPDSSLPSTDSVDDRPQTHNAPSTLESVDGEPSTDFGLPSTQPVETIHLDGKPSTGENSAVHIRKKLPSTKGDRHNKFLARYDNRVNPQIKQRIDVFCAKFDLSQREFAEQSAVHFIDVWTAKFEKNVDGKTAQDDRGKMIMWKTSPPLINLYRLYNSENKWKFKDDEVAARYSGMDIRIVELGIIETQFNSNFKKINSFGYYQNEIDNFANQKLSEEMLNFLLIHYRKKYAAAVKRELDYAVLEPGE